MNRDGAVTEPEEDVLRNHGIMNYRGLKQLVNVPRQWLVAGLIQPKSVNIIVGDSGLGKTPFCVGLGLAVASGQPFLGRPVAAGPVLYIDGESQSDQFAGTVSSISEAIGLKEPPANFWMWSPFWTDSATSASMGADVVAKVHLLKPSLVVVDPLRVFFPKAEDKSADAMLAITAMRKTTDAAFLIPHHPRKPLRDGAGPSLSDDPHGWLKEAAGSSALVQNMDTRLGVIKSETEHSDLTICGYVRGLGKIGALHLKRKYNEFGDPVCYEPAAGTSLLSLNQQQVYASLPEEFRFKDIQVLTRSNGSKAAQFLKDSLELGLVAGPKGGPYRKVAPGKEHLE